MSCQKVGTLTKYIDWTTKQLQLQKNPSKSARFTANDRMLVKPFYNLALLLIRRVVTSQVIIVTLKHSRQSEHKSTFTCLHWMSRWNVYRKEKTFIGSIGFSAGRWPSTDNAHRHKRWNWHFSKLGKNTGWIKTNHPISRPLAQPLGQFLWT